MICPAIARRHVQPRSSPSSIAGAGCPANPTARDVDGRIESNGSRFWSHPQREDFRIPVGTQADVDDRSLLGLPEGISPKIDALRGEKDSRSREEPAKHPPHEPRQHCNHRDGECHTGGISKVTGQAESPTTKGDTQSRERHSSIQQEEEEIEDGSDLKVIPPQNEDTRADVAVLQTRMLNVENMLQEVIQHLSQRPAPQ